MFTGIVEEVGRVTRIEQRGENRRITIAAGNASKELKAGDSGHDNLMQRCFHGTFVLLSKSYKLPSRSKMIEVKL